MWEVDFVRGICLLLMFLDHAMYDFWMLDGWFSNFYEIDNIFITAMNTLSAIYWVHPVRVGVRICVVATFFILSGVSSSFSRNQGLRLIKLTLAACVLAGITQMADSLFNLDVSIYFGILHCMALSLIIFIGLRFISGDYNLDKESANPSLMRLKKLSLAKYLYLAVGVLIVAAANFDWLNLPYVPYSKSAYLDIILGFKMAGADCYGVFPYVGFFLIGCFAGKTLYSKKRSLAPRGDCLLTKPIAFVGKNTLIMYLVHQPIILGIILIICLCLGYLPYF